MQKSLSDRIGNIFVWFLCIAMVVSAILFGTGISDNLGGMSMICVIFSLYHSMKRFGLKNTVIIFIIVNVIAMLFENVSILTTIPFGNYYYTELMGGKIFLVPFGINTAYFGMVYICMTITEKLYGDHTLTIHNAVFRSVITGFLMVMWDLLFDPFMSTIKHFWIWEEGGAYYGVPMSNFIGWFLCVFTMSLLINLWLLRSDRRNHIVESSSGSVTTTVSVSAFSHNDCVRFCILYGGWLVGFLIRSCVSYPIETVCDAVGKTWYTSDIFSGCAIVGLFTSLFVIVLVLLLDHEAKN